MTNNDFAKEFYVGRVFWLASSSSSTPEPVKISGVRADSNTWDEKPVSLVISFEKKTGRIDIFCGLSGSLDNELRGNNIFLSEKEAAKAMLRILRETFDRKVAKLNMLIDKVDE